MFHKVLIANRGEIAVRIIRACKEMGVRTVAIYSTADKSALHVQLADEAICIGGPSADQSYLNMASILSAACASGCDAIHPGFGFLSESPLFARMVKACGLSWIGPNPDVMEKMGNKSEAISIMKDAGVPIVPGSYGAVSAEEGLAIAQKIGFPVLIKASAGGGGKGIRQVSSEAEFMDLYHEAKDEAKKFFGNDELYVEKLVLNPRHVEVQVVGDQHENYIHLFERNCSMQRRKQKILEEAPCQSISSNLKNRLYEAALKACKAVKYDSVGTIEFLIDEKENFYFIEMNTRIQVEHSITEEITGIDIVKLMIKIASGAKLPYKQEDIHLNGFAIECRINAEDVSKDFRPQAGKITFLNLPGGKGVRVDTAVYPGYVIPPFYDSMILKLVVHGENRLECIRKMREALAELIIEGVPTTTEFHYCLMHHSKYILGNFTTAFVEEAIKDLENNVKLIR